jgi:hypothetical protein
MFSANENILQRQHKKRVVEYVESTIPENVLDLGVNVMAMQVNCTAPGCVPIETAVIIIFPKLNDKKELLPGLPESAIGGSYKTKILKPLAEVTKEDVLDALPPAFMGGTKSIEKLCYQIRDNLFAQITQLFDDNNNIVSIGGANESTTIAEDGNGASMVTGGQHPRLLVAKYIQECLQQYINHNCIPPEFGQPYPDDVNSDTTGGMVNTDVPVAVLPSLPTEPINNESPRLVIPSTGNVTIPRPMDHDSITTTGTMDPTTKPSSVSVFSTNEVGTNPSVP